MKTLIRFAFRGLYQFELTIDGVAYPDRRVQVKAQSRGDDGIGCDSPVVQSEPRNGEGDIHHPIDDADCREIIYECDRDIERIGYGQHVIFDSGFLRHSIASQTVFSPNLIVYRGQAAGVEVCP